jgi:CheY-like chemotaxis protein
MSRPRVLLAEDNPVMAAELRALLEPELEVVATVTDGAALVAAADTARPDVIVTDIVMPHRSGIDATVELLRRHVLKVAAATDLMPAVHAALRNERYVSSRLRGRPSER